MVRNCRGPDNAGCCNSCCIRVMVCQVARPGKHTQGLADGDDASRWGLLSGRTRHLLQCLACSGSLLLLSICVYLHNTFAMVRLGASGGACEAPCCKSCVAAMCTQRPCMCSTVVHFHHHKCCKAPTPIHGVPAFRRHWHRSALLCMSGMLLGHRTATGQPVAMLTSSTNQLSSRHHCIRNGTRCVSLTPHTCMTVWAMISQTRQCLVTYWAHVLLPMLIHPAPLSCFRGCFCCACGPLLWFVSSVMVRKQLVL